VRDVDEARDGDAALGALADLVVLDALAASWRVGPLGERRFVPGFDPLGPGTDARVLVLLQSPAPVTVSHGVDAVASEDNDAPSSRAFRAARLESGLGRGDYLRWNVVPWALENPVTQGPGAGRPASRRTGPTPDELDAAAPALHALLTALPHLRAVVALGDATLAGVMRYLTLHDSPVIVPVLAAPHPSPANGHRRHERHVRIVNALRRARSLAD
jgi:hypothetical protein